MPRTYRYIEVPHRHMPIPNDDLPVSVDVALSVGFAFDDDAHIVARLVTELIVTVDDLADGERRSLRIPVDFTDDLIAALQAASARYEQLHIQPTPDDHTDHDTPRSDSSSAAA